MNKKYHKTFRYPYNNLTFPYRTLQWTFSNYTWYYHWLVPHQFTRPDILYQLYHHVLVVLVQIYPITTTAQLIIYHNISYISTHLSQYVPYHHLIVPIWPCHNYVTQYRPIYTVSTFDSSHRVPPTIHMPEYAPTPFTCPFHKCFNLI